MNREIIVVIVIEFGKLINLGEIELTCKLFEISLYFSSHTGRIRWGTWWSYYDVIDG